MRIKNWKKFQHFKDRRPPWIKVHRELLDQRDIGLLSDLSFRVLVLLWLLASEDEDKNGNLPNMEDIAYRLRMAEKDITKSLQELGEWIDYTDITLISKRQQVVPPEVEGETETEKKKSSRFAPPSTTEVQEYCKERNNTVDPERWIDHYTSNGWMVGKNKMKNWKAAVRTWEKTSKPKDKPTMTEFLTA